ncbi:MAG TPA: hypothetical protein VIC62_05835, partial [Nakamurella sp.]
VDQRTASRDLTELTRLDLLEPHGQAGARYYRATESWWQRVRPTRLVRTPLTDPYPGFMAQLRGAADA